MRGNPDFDTVLAWVASELEDAKTALVTRPVADVQIYQGMARAFGGVLNAAKNAPEVLRRLNSN